MSGSTSRRTVKPADNGLNRREYFAAMAMQALLGNTQFNNSSFATWSPKDIAKHSVTLADLLIAELDGEMI